MHPTLYLAKSSTPMEAKINTDLETVYQWLTANELTFNIEKRNV